MRQPRFVPPPVPGGFGYPAGFLAAILVTLAAVAAHATTHPDRAVIPLSCTAAAIAAISTLRAAFATAATSWALYSGFVLGRRGELVFTSSALRDARLLGTVTLIAFALAAAIRTAHAHHQATGPTAHIPAPRSAAAAQDPVADAASVVATADALGSSKAAPTPRKLSGRGWR